MATKCARPVVVLAVDIHGDTAANGCKTCAGHHGREPSFRCKYLQKFANLRTGFDVEDAGLGVKLKHAVHPRHVDHPAAIVQTGVAIATTHPKRGGS